MRNTITRFIKGLIIGVAALTAGVGTFAIILGIYDRCMEIIAKPFKNFKDNLIFILPILIGIGISAVGCAKLISFLLENYNAYTRSAFLGIIIGGIPTLFKVANKDDLQNLKKIIANKDGFKRPYLISTMVALIITIVLTMFANSLKEGTEVTSITMLEAMIYGAIYAWGAVMPGMTTVHVLMYMGVWGVILSRAAAFDWTIIVPFGLGYVALALLTANMITFLFKKLYGYTYYAIIGFSITSLVMFIPQYNGPLELIIGTLIVFAFLFLTLELTKIEVKKEENKQIVEEKET